MTRWQRSFVDQASARPPGPANAADARLASAGRSRPVVLLVTTRNWIAPARLALELCEAGFVVRAVCPAGNVLKRVTFVEATRWLPPFNQLRALRREIEAAAPDLIAPADDVAARLLHALHASARGEGPSNERLRRLLERSLGGRGGHDRLYARTGVAAVAGAQDVAGPQTRVITTLAALQEGLAEFGLPAVLKTDGSSGGEGVSIVCSPAEAEREWRRLSAPPSLLWCLKRLIVDHEVDRLADWVRGRPVVNLQVFVPGRPATAAAALWRGEVLACVCSEVIETLSPLGPATVVRVVRHPQMREAVARMARRLELSGLCGFDFILDEADEAHLVEINPRATPTAHLMDADGRSPPRALCAAVLGDPVPMGEDRAGERVALFPQELIRDPKSEHLVTARHDVPVRCQELVRLGRKLVRRRVRSARFHRSGASVHQSEIRMR